MTNDQIAAKAKEIMAETKCITRADLARKLGIYRGKLDALESQGLLVLPPKLTASQSATLGRNKSKLMNGWFINRPANYGGTG